MNKIIIIILSALLGLGFVGFIVFAKESKKKATPEGDTTKAITFSPLGVTRGASDAPLKFVEFADFQCPYCGSAHPIIDQVLAEYEGKVQFTFKHFPLLSIHKNALPAALATEAAGEQGKFWEMHNVIFERQQDWSNEPSSDKKFEEYAKELGLDVEKFKEDVKKDELSKKIDDQRNEGIEVGVSSTPTFFLNGKRIEPESLSVESFKKLFDAELAKGIPSSTEEVSTPSADSENGTE